MPENAGGYCAGLVDAGDDMNGAATACATPALLIQKIPAAGMVGIALGIGVMAFFIAIALTGRQRSQS